MGDNQFGQLGNGTESGSATPTDVKTITTASKIGTGAFHACGIISSTPSNIQCWGGNNRGQIGDGSQGNRPLPATVLGALTATSVSGGVNHTCAITGTGTIHCWGAGSIGQLGNGQDNDSLTPVPVSGISTATSISAGDNHTCAVDAGMVKCWGENGLGRLGNGSTVGSNLPVPVSNLSGVTAVAVALGGYHSCAITSNGSVFCWGSNEFGQLGVGSGNPVPSSDVALQVAGISAKAITAGLNHTCAILLIDDTVRCWGNNESGQLGIGDPSGTPKDVPTLVLEAEESVTGLKAIAISAGEKHTCAMILSPSGTMKCWGYNDFGQIGSGLILTEKTPTNVNVLN
jgi:alpha-tubulin suppressor-like RCC1 family protein